MRWAGVLVGPIAWAVVLQTNYTMSYVACEQGTKWMLHAAVAAAAVVIAIVAAGAWRVLPAAPPGSDPSGATSGSDPMLVALGRARFMSFAAVGLSLWFMLAILAMEVPALLLQPCNP